MALMKKMKALERWYSGPWIARLRRFSKGLSEIDTLRPSARWDSCVSVAALDEASRLDRLEPCSDLLRSWRLAELAKRAMVVLMLRRRIDNGFKKGLSEEEGAEVPAAGCREGRSPSVAGSRVFSRMPVFHTWWTLKRSRNIISRISVWEKRLMGTHSKSKKRTDSPWSALTGGASLVSPDTTKGVGSMARGEGAIEAASADGWGRGEEVDCHQV